MDTVIVLTSQFPVLEAKEPERAKAAAKQKNAAGTAARAQTKRAAGGSAPQCPLGVCSGAPTTVTNNVIDDR